MTAWDQLRGFDGIGSGDDGGVCHSVGGEGVGGDTISSRDVNGLFVGKAVMAVAVTVTVMINLAGAVKVMVEDTFLFIS